MSGREHPLDRIRVLTRTFVRNRPAVSIKCDVCNQSSEERTLKQKDVPPDVIMRWFKTNGWDIQGDGKAAICPSCIAKTRHRGKKREVIVLPELRPHERPLTVDIGKALADAIESRALPLETKPVERTPVAPVFAYETSDPLFRVVEDASGPTHIVVAVPEPTPDDPEPGPTGEAHERPERRRYRRHTEEYKQKVVADLEADPTRRAEVLVRWDISSSQLSTWRAIYGQRERERLRAEQPHDTGADVAQPDTQTQPSKELLKQQRAVYALLTDVYMEEEKAYADDWTDAKVAAKCEISIEHVTRIRESAFGPLEDRAAKEVRDALAKLNKDFKDEMLEMRKMLTDMEARYKAKVDALTAKVARGSGSD